MKAAKMKRLSVAMGLAFWSLLAHADESTVYRYVFQVHVDGRPAVSHYFTAVASAGGSTEIGWGSASCPDARYVYTRELEGQKDVLAAVLAAAAAGKQVYFRGTCDSADYFRATGVWVKH